MAWDFKLKVDRGPPYDLLRPRWENLGVVIGVAIFWAGVLASILP